MTRHPIPSRTIFNIQTLCYGVDDDMRWIIATRPDGGMRLAEVIGLGINDLFLDTEITSVWLSERPWRRLKTSTNTRNVPLVGIHLWGLKRAANTTEGSLIFPRYCSVESNKANYVSNAFKNWPKAYMLEIFVIHSF